MVSFYKNSLLQLSAYIVANITGLNALTKYLCVVEGNECIQRRLHSFIDF